MTIKEREMILNLTQKKGKGKILRQNERIYIRYI